MAKLKERHIGIELLRIVSMIMVLGLHANFLALKAPLPSEILSSNGITRVFFQSLCIMAVNVFVMISGWFGIRASVKGFLNFIFQVFYFVALEYLVCHFFFGLTLTGKDLLRCFGLFSGGGWFVASYIGLYILSPILNVFIKQTSLKAGFLILLLFVLYENLWGDTYSVDFIVAGYSTFSFIGVYIYAGLLKRLGTTVRADILSVIFFTCVILNTTMYIVSTQFHIVVARDWIMNYINPLVLIEAGSLILIFDRIRVVKNYRLKQIVYFVASSSFSAYLFHVGTPIISNMYASEIVRIYNSSAGVASILEILLFVLGVFTVAILFDVPRRLCWNKLILSFLSRNK